MIIIEGSDQVGKTTFARRVLDMAKGRNLDMQYRHMSRPDAGFDHVAGYMQPASSALVQDRFHLGAVVYGMMLQRGGYPSAARMRLVQNYLLWQGCVTVIMHAQRDWLRERAGNDPRKEMYGIDDILDANDGYRALTRLRNGDVPYCQVSYDVTDRWPDDGDAGALLDRWCDTWLK